MKDQPVTHDERTVVVENSSYRVAYLLLSFGLLLIVAYRAWVWRESSWDLLALVILSGLVATLYQGAHKILSRHWVLAVITTVLVAVVFAAAIAILR